METQLRENPSVKIALKVLAMAKLWDETGGRKAPLISALLLIKAEEILHNEFFGTEYFVWIDSDFNISIHEAEPFEIPEIYKRSSGPSFKMGKHIETIKSGLDK
jgi:hypothetical protein